MQSILEQITDWLKSMIISGIMGNLSGMFDSVNQQVGQIAGDVGTTPANFSPDPQHLGIRDPAHCRNGADFHRLL
jgi:hypothetical protein